MGDELTNIALIGIGGILGLALVLRAAGSIAAFISGLPQPDAGPAGGVGIFFDPAHPGPVLGVPALSPILFWAITAILLAGVLTLVLWGVVAGSPAHPPSGGRSAPARRHRDRARGRPSRLHQSPHAPRHNPSTLT